MAELIAIPAVARHLSGMVSGLDIRYDVGVSGHPLLGARIPDRPLDLHDGGHEQLARLLHAARGVIVSADVSGETIRCTAGWSDRVDVARVASFPAGAEDGGAATESVLIRPDGYVAWAAPGGGPLPEALRRWFGAPRDVRQTIDAPPLTARALSPLRSRSISSAITEED
jgi:bifunctional hydroxylase/dehydrase